MAVLDASPFQKNFYKTIACWFNVVVLKTQLLNFLTVRLLFSTYFSVNF